MQKLTLLPFNQLVYIQLQNDRQTHNHTTSSVVLIEIKLKIIANT